MDCDPGHDDAMALMLAQARPEINIRGVTTSAGNQTIDKTTLNARKIMSFLGNPVPVAAGSPKPLFRDLITAPEVHGESGLDGPSLPEPKWPVSELSACELMVKILEESHEPIGIIATGALTNLAALLLYRDDLKKKIARVSLMGGAAIGGNWTASAEFNILVDPEAAQIVFSSGLPIIMSGLDVTHKAIVTSADIESMRALGGPASLLAAELMDYFKIFSENHLSHLGGSPLHDPCAVAVLVAPQIFTAKKARVDVECHAEHTTGATVVSLAQGEMHNGSVGHVPRESANVEVLIDIDRRAFIRILIEALIDLDKNQP